MKNSSKEKNNLDHKSSHNLCDKKNIDSFLNQNSEKKVVVVQGLGFVGAVMSLVCVML